MTLIHYSIKIDNFSYTNA